MSLIKEQIVRELHRPARRNFVRRHTVIKGINDLWQADLAEMQHHSRQNKGYRYILVVINCFSKYVWTAPLKTKSAKDVAAAMRSILQNVPDAPKHLQTDRGTEFYNSDFKRVMDKFNIKHYSTFSDKKAAIVERVIRTLKERLHIQFAIQGNFKWLHILKNVVSDYNHAKHRTIKMAPTDVTASTHLDYPRDVTGARTKPRFNVGDIVRISSHKEWFEKGYEGNWSPAQFVVSEVKKTIPPTYLLKDEKNEALEGCFYEEEMLKVKHPGVFLVEKVLRHKGNKSYVKWWGIPEKNWVPTKDVNV